MFSLTKQMFIVLLSFSESLSRDRIKSLFINDEPCIVGSTFIDMNTIELKYYPFMIGLNKCTGRCNVLSPKICFPNETKDINVKTFNMITDKDEAKALTQHISCDCKFNSTKCNSKQKLNNKICQCECKNYRKCKKDYSWNPSTCVCENSTYLKSAADTSVTECNEIVIVIDIVSTKKTNTVTTKKTIL